MTVLGLVPRRADGLPPGQREVRDFPRFSDKPLRWAPTPAPIEFKVSVNGEHRATFAAADLDQFDHVEQVSDFHCVTTWTHRGLRWGGVRLADLVAVAIDETPPPFAVADAADRQSAIFATDDLQASDVLLATELHGAPLDRKHGAPLRLVCPSQYGYKNVKHVTAIDFRTERPESTMGSKEHLRARVAFEERHATMPNWMVRVPYRLTIIPTALVAERGLRRSPE